MIINIFLSSPKYFQSRDKVPLKFLGFSTGVILPNPPPGLLCPN
jgi:hypothetical protein